MAVQSIRAPVQVGDVAGDHLLVASRQMSLGEMNGVGKLNHLPQEIGTRAEALDDTWYLLSSRAGTPEIVGGGGFSSGLCIFNNANFGRVQRLARLRCCGQTGCVVVRHDKFFPLNPLWPSRTEVQKVKSQRVERTIVQK